MSVDIDLRDLLAEVTGLDVDKVRALPADTPLLGDGLAIGSRDGARLLLRVRERFDVDVAGEDLALTSLESIGTLAAFVAARRAAR
jgi:acyl carrier protein